MKIRKVTKDTMVCDALALNKGVVKAIQEKQMGFLLCPTCQLDTLEEVSEQHGIEIEKILDAFNNLNSPID